MQKAPPLGGAFFGPKAISHCSVGHASIATNMDELIVKNPYNLQEVARVDRMSESTVMQKLDNAYQQTLNPKTALPPQKRVKILESTYKILESKKEKIVETAVSEGGKPFQDSLAEVERGLEGIRYAIEEIPNLRGKEVPMGLNSKSMNKRAFTVLKPRGVVVSISAFNHPFNLAVHQVIPAIAASCPVLIKPAADTPLSAKLLVDALHEAGLPESYCQYVLCDNDVAEKLVNDKRNSFLSFIGSAKVGWHLRSQLPPGATCALEHGGAAPVIIDESADIDRLLPGLIKASYYHAGQVCVSAQRLFVHESIKSTFMERFVVEVQRLKLGDPMNKETDLGALIRPQEVERVAEWVGQSGGEILTGGKKLSETCYEQTVVLNPSEDSKLSQKEIFGPVTAVFTYESLEEAIQKANAPDFAFQSSIYTQEIDKAMKAANELEARTVMINEHPAFRVDWMPFGGYRSSGLGVGGIGYSMKDMSIEKMIVINSPEL